MPANPAPTNRPASLSPRDAWAYALLGGPLAMAALPIYVVVPNFYAAAMGLELAVVGTVLMLARLLDAGLDPVFGVWSDRSARLPGGRQRFVRAGLPVLALGMLALFIPPTLEPVPAAAWLAVTVVVAYVGYSLISVSYQAWAAELATDPTVQTRLCALREGCALAGVLVASVLPTALANWWGQREAYGAYACLFALVLLAAGAVTLRGAPRAPAQSATTTTAAGGWRAPLLDPAFRALAAVFVLNGLAVSIPSTLVLFYIADLLQRPDLTGLFLGLYFLAAACGMPAWVALAARLGLRRAWWLGMLLAVAAFAWAVGLGSGEVVPFALVCIASGLALGADLAFPPALLAGVVEARADRDQPGAAGLYFGWWNLLAKLTLALAAGIALPLLGVLGYAPGQQDAQGTAALAAIYALLPCALKVLAALLLTRVHAPSPRVPPETSEVVP